MARILRTSAAVRLATFAAVAAAAISCAAEVELISREDPSDSSDQETTGSTGPSGGRDASDGGGGAGANVSDGGSLPTWGPGCEGGCEAHALCTDVDRCTDLGITCESNPQPQIRNLTCLMECVGDQATTCDEVMGVGVGATSILGPDSRLIECIAQCNDPPTPISGTFACNKCIGGTNRLGVMGPGFCHEHLSCSWGASNDTDACASWVRCVQQCPDSACFAQCDVDHPAAASSYLPFYDCVCNDIPAAEIVDLMGFEARCTDVCSGLMNACDR